MATSDQNLQEDMSRSVDDHPASSTSPKVTSADNMNETRQDDSQVRESDSPLHERENGQSSEHMMEVSASESDNNISDLKSKDADGNCSTGLSDKPMDQENSTMTISSNTSESHSEDQQGSIMKTSESEAEAYAPKKMKIDGSCTNCEENADKSREDNKLENEPGTSAEPMNVDLPPLDASTANGQSDSENNDGSQSVYHIKWICFKNKQVPIITQNENGPCPLIAILNVLLLQNRIKLSASTELITASQLMAHLGECMLENVPGTVNEGTRLNLEQNMSDAMAVMPKLQTGLDVNVRFTGIRDFEYTRECIIFDLLQISLYHGWLVDPQNEAEVHAVGKHSYNQLVEKIINKKASENSQEVNEALLAEQFLENSASQLTYHGLCELCSRVKDDELAVFFRNNHFSTLYRQKDELFLLVTDQGFLSEGNVVWETLSNVEGDCHFVDTNFHTYTKPEPPTEPVPQPEVPVGSDQQIDQDFLVALSLQEEQQLHEEQQLAWEQAKQQTHMSDLELAQRLQEEENRRAAAARANQQAAGQQSPQNGRGQERRQRERERERDREDKKDGCCIL